MAVRMEVQYAYQVNVDTSISCTVYCQINPFQDSSIWAYAYDETALVRLDEIVRMLADRDVADPKHLFTDSQQCESAERRGTRSLFFFCYHSYFFIASTY